MVWCDFTFVSFLIPWPRRASFLQFEIYIWHSCLISRGWSWMISNPPIKRVDIFLCFQYLDGGFQIFFIFIPIWGNDPKLTNIFQRGWNHQLDIQTYLYVCRDIFIYIVLFNIFCVQYTGLPIHLLENGPSAFEKITCFFLLNFALELRRCIRDSEWSGQEDLVWHRCPLGQRSEVFDEFCFPQFFLAAWKTHQIERRYVYTYIYSQIYLAILLFLGNLGKTWH